MPVGDDQKQHLELANDIAEKFNHDYGVPDFFPHIEPLIQSVAARVMSLRDGTKKMSKSDASDQSRINLTDDRDAIALKIRRAKTDPEPLPEHMCGPRGPAGGAQPGRHPGRRHRHAAGERAARAWRQGLRRFKEVLVEALVDHLSPIQAEMQRLLGDHAALDAALRLGAQRAAAIAEPIVTEAERVVGFLPR